MAHFDMLHPVQAFEGTMLLSNMSVKPTIKCEDGLSDLLVAAALLYSFHGKT